VETQKPTNVPPLDIALVLIVTFFVFLFGSVALFFTVSDEVTIVVGEILILAVPLAYLLMRRINIRTFVRIETNPKYIIMGIGFGVLLLLLNLIVSNVLTYVFGISQTVEQANSQIMILSGSPTGLAAVVASLTLAGVCEEFAFRGFLQNSIFKSLIKNPKTNRYAFIFAATISAAVFGFFHFDPQAVYTIAAFISGLALGYIYHKWNYTTSATAHASMNLIVLAFLILGI
jgi:membrane protease YdiL (CAAX protease family)